MKTPARILQSLSFLLVGWAAVPTAGATTLSQTVINVVDTNPSAGIFEANLSADEQDANINGTTVHALIYKDDNNPAAYPPVAPDGIPIPQIIVNVDDEIIVHLTNRIDTNCAAIACTSSIHWHGLELDNDSDGTGVTQNHLLEGETYTYRFRAPRPGVFWFHTHMLPGPQTFAGMYGTFIVKDPNEATLQREGTIPAAANTHTVVLSDTEFDANGNVGYLGGGVVAKAWATLRNECEAGTQASCQTVKDGQTVLFNGQSPSAGPPMIASKSGAGIRLRLINTATNRYFRLKVSNNGGDNNLYRIGGEGGFLEQVRLEGGTLGTWDTKYDLGEIVLPSSSRADVVIVPKGNSGDIITITGLGYERGGPSNNTPAGVLLQIKIDNTIVDTPFSIAAGDDILGPGGVENLKPLAISDFYTNPVPFIPGGVGSPIGSTDETIRMTAVGPGELAIDDVIGEFEDSGPDYTQVPYQAASRYASTGDVLELTISNFTRLHHPFHHHGFSFQPVRVIDNGPLTNTTADDTVLYEFDYNEFVDTIDVFGEPASNQSIVFRIRLEDRPRITDNRQEAGAPPPNHFFASGGAAGRWVFHCHLFLHAALGMISELVVQDIDRDGDGFDTSKDCDDFDPNKNLDDGGVDFMCNAPRNITPFSMPVAFSATARTEVCGVKVNPEITRVKCTKVNKKGKRVKNTKACKATISGDTISFKRRAKVRKSGGGVGTRIVWRVKADPYGVSFKKKCKMNVVGRDKAIKG